MFLGWRDQRPLSDLLPAKEAKLLDRKLELKTVEDLLLYFPRGWTDSSQSPDSEHLTCMGRILHSHTRYGHRGGKVHEIAVQCPQGVIRAVFFRAQLPSQVLVKDRVVLLSGKAENGLHGVRLLHPDFLVMPGPHNSAVGGGQLAGTNAYAKKLPEIVKKYPVLPIYPAKKGLNSWRIMMAVLTVLEKVPPIPEPLRRVPRGMLSMDRAIRGMHTPGPEGSEPAARRMKYNEALTLGLVMALRRADTETRKAPPIPRVAGGAYDRQMESLPFEFTNEQQRCLREIESDLARNRPMSRLLQGEVGSGKTVVALMAMLRCVDDGKQCVLLAPTEVLAAQHASSIKMMLARENSNVKVTLLTGSMQTAKKKQSLLDIVTGESHIVIGTHALIQKNVEFYDLGLVIVDEQHRFGVEQRDRLRAKGRDGMTPHLLVMTATPIPRTVAITVFGDLAVSTMRGLPKGRQTIQTALVPDNKPAWKARARQRMYEEMRDGRQVYLVCPRIHNAGGVLEVGEYMKEYFKEFNVGILHGQMTGEEKDEIMGKFVAGDINLLVSTTVIEVGVDVANASMIVIREAESFGVSQLHQLRGRVGRGPHKSLCLLHTKAEPGSPALMRLQQVAEHDNGFKLAEVDLAMRREGDVLGTSQSGTDGKLKTLNLLEDYNLIMQANRDAELLVKTDREWAAATVRDYEERTTYLEKS